MIIGSHEWWKAIYNDKKSSYKIKIMKMCVMKRYVPLLKGKKRPWHTQVNKSILVDSFNVNPLNELRLIQQNIHRSHYPCVRYYCGDLVCV